MPIETPVAFCIFNRPELTEVVFQRIAEAQPKKLYVYSDGPRPDQPGESERVDHARRIAESVDWDCDLRTNYSDINLGCKIRMSTGITWALEQNERVIVLEDDCVPGPSFFAFCESLLDRYSNDDRVMAISGNNFQREPRTRYSYYFSKLPHCWGWATWSRAWKKFDVALTTWPEVKQQGLIEAVTDSAAEAAYYTEIFDAVYSGRLDSWAYGWLYSCLFNHGLTALPNVNLVSNIGFGVDATHTTVNQVSQANLPAEELGELRHPPYLFRNKAADIYTFEHIFCPAQVATKQSLRRKLKNKFRTMKGRRPAVV